MPGWDDPPKPDPTPPLISALSALRRAYNQARAAGEDTSELEDLGKRVKALLDARHVTVTGPGV